MGCVAASINTGDEGAAGAIGLSGLAGHLQGSKLTSELAGEVMQTANIIETNMMYLQQSVR